MYVISASYCLIGIADKVIAAKTGAFHEKHTGYPPQPSHPLGG
ncbi:hypothetical protein ACVWZT_004317 [Pseudomonas sp. TE21394]